MRGIRQLLGGLWLMALTSVAAATGIEGLYEAELRVSSQAVEERETALRVGLERVLVRVSGRQYLSDPVLREALRQSERYLQQFSYSRDEDDDLTLRVRFDERSVNGLLEEAGLAVWGRIRPWTLVWLAVDNGSERVLLDGGSDHRVRRIVTEKSRRFGLPLEWPLMDLRDRRRVRASDVWGGIEEPILEASRRYAPQAILIGRVQPLAEGGWEARWRLLGIGEPRQWENRGGVLEEVITPGMERTFAGLAATYAGVEQDEDRVRLEVAGITGLEDYAGIRDYLAGLSEVRGLQVEALDGGRMTLELELRGGARGLARTIALGGTLVAAGEGMDTVGPQPVPEQGVQRLEYRYLP
ncbi:MAG: DUF2066 domain-containing protein [Pseudomonadota bacterium]